MVLFELFLVGGLVFFSGSKEIPRYARILGRLSGKSIKFIMEIKNELSSQETEAFKVILFINF